MKKILATTLAFGMLAWAGSAMAAIYTDTFTPNTQYMEAEWVSTGWVSGYWVDGTTINWDFDITDDGFTPGTDTVTSAVVDLNFTDDSDWDWSEHATLDVGSNTFSWEVDSGEISYTLTSLMTLNASGTVDASLTATGGDFIFNTATLTAEGPDSAPIPEPSTMLLFGTGILSLVGFSRRRSSKKN